MSVCPLAPLSFSEVGRASAIARRDKALGSEWRFVAVQLHEPAKRVVLQRLAWVEATPAQQRAAVDRQAFLILFSRRAEGCVEAVVSLDQDRVLEWTHVAGVHPAVMPEEYKECEAVVKQSSAFANAMLRRGVTDMSLVMVDVWTAGRHRVEEDEDRDLRGKRICKPLIFVKNGPQDNNGYAHPVEGLEVVVDLSAMEVVKVLDFDAVPIPKASGDFTVSQHVRTGLRPLTVAQPEGVSFTVDGHHVQWQGWDFRVGFNAREGLTLHTVSFDNDGSARPILYRASIAEMIVPYGDPRRPHYRKQAFDAGEEGLGFNTNSLQECDCEGVPTFFDAVLSDADGAPMVIPRAVCMHEASHGTLWRHTDWRSGRCDMRKARRLVLMFAITVANYDYMFNWHFEQDGTLSFESHFTGIVNITPMCSVKDDYRSGVQVSAELNAPLHQHYITMRLDMCVDGPTNFVEEVETLKMTEGPANHQSNGFEMAAQVLHTEADGRNVNPLAGRFWRIGSSTRRTAYGKPTAYRLVPGETTLPYAHPASPFLQRAPFLTKNLWVTPYHAGEKFPAGDYPNQNAASSGVVQWVKQGRSIRDADLVLWWTTGMLHVPRPEEWPVMPLSRASWALRPDGFFAHNPILTVPASKCAMAAKL